MTDGPTLPDALARRLAAGAVATAVATLVYATPAAAHEGSTHAGTPHRALLGLLLLGGALAGGSLLAARGRWADRPRRVLAGAFLGSVLALAGLVALVELQVEPSGADATPIPRAWYPSLALGAGFTIVLGSLAVGLRRWPERPDYVALGSALGLWVAYPVLVPGVAYFHPFGYLLVLAVPLLVGVVYWTDVRPALDALDAGARRIGVAAAVLFVAFFLVSTGQFTFNPDQGATGLDGPFFVVTEFAAPLVLWPAVEFYLPSIPLFGALSVGTAITFGLLGGLVGTNAALAATLRRHDDARATGSTGAVGGVATTGATACCCCAPAAYSVVSAALGASATPLYWAFLDPASPAGALFFVAATGLMTASAVQLADALDAAGACDRPR